MVNNMKSHSKSGKTKLRILEIILFAMLGAILYVAQVALAFLPNIEVVSLLLICYTIVYGKRVFYPLLVFLALEGITYGFGIWWISYLYIWPLLVLVSLLFRRMRSAVGWSVLSGFFGLLFGFLYALIFLFLGGPGAMIATWVSGLGFDLMHCLGNFLTCLVLFHPLSKVLEQIRTSMEKALVHPGQRA